MTCLPIVHRIVFPIKSVTCRQSFRSNQFPCSQISVNFQSIRKEFLQHNFLAFHICSRIDSIQSVALQNFATSFITLDFGPTHATELFFKFVARSNLLHLSQEIRQWLNPCEVKSDCDCPNRIFFGNRTENTCQRIQSHQN